MMLRVWDFTTQKIGSTLGNPIFITSSIKYEFLSHVDHQFGQDSAAADPVLHFRLPTTYDHRAADLKGEYRNRKNSLRPLNSQ